MITYVSSFNVEKQMNFDEALTIAYWLKSKVCLQSNLLNVMKRHFPDAGEEFYKRVING